MWRAPSNGCLLVVHLDLRVTQAESRSANFQTWFNNIDRWRDTFSSSRGLYPQSPLLTLRPPVLLKKTGVA
jgi:hypothetical protein